MVQLIDRWSGLLSLRFLEAGEGLQPDGSRHAKTVPFGILAEATSGSYELLSGGRRVLGPCGSVIFAASNVPLVFIHHGPEPHADMRFRFAHFSFSLGGGLDILDLFDPPDVLTGEAARTAADCIDRLLALPRADGTPLTEMVQRHAIGAALLGTLTATASLHPAAGERLAGAEQLAPLLRALHDRLASPLDVAALAKMANLSRSSLHRAFSTTFGTPPMEYLKRLRLDEAARRLMQSDVSVTTLASEVGFANAYHLSREFKARFGMPPSVYRRDNPFRIADSAS